MAYQREFYLDVTKGPIRFSVIWAAMSYIPQTGQARNIEVLRREGLISKKLRNISLMNGNGRKLKEGDQKLILEQTEIDLIRQRIESFPFWNPTAEDSPADVYDWLNSGTEII